MELKPRLAGTDTANRPLPFNRAARVGGEQENINAAIDGGHLAANGPFTARCTEWLSRQLGSPALLVHSCTAALEMAAILVGIEPGDEVVMPSYTFVSTANAFVMRGATPVFVDIEEDTLNIDPEMADSALTARTRAVVPVHYAGVGCRMKEVLDLAGRHGAVVIEDAAQGLLASVADRPLGTIGALGALSFHETKNVTCGEGGALIVNDPELLERAEVIRDKGTDRSRFLRGQTDKYTWVDLGSSHGLSELGAAFLASQLEAAHGLTQRRLELWQRYHEAFLDVEREGRLRRPTVPPRCVHNAHMYYVLLESQSQRDSLIARLREGSIGAVFHYVPLHDSPAGRRYGRASGPLSVTESVAPRLLRLPLWSEMENGDVDRVVDEVCDFLTGRR